MPVLKYQTAASDFLRQSFAELAAGDLRQASEKGWGAAALVVKAVAEVRGWEHRSHDDLFTVVDRLARELPEVGLFTDFHAAASLHQNYYEGWQTEAMVRQGLAQVQRFTAALTPLLPGAPSR